MSQVLAPPFRLPRQIEADDRRDAIHAALAVHRRCLWAGGTLEVPWLDATDPLLDALRTAAQTGRLCRGLEAAIRILANEQHSRDTLAARGVAPPGEAVSRMLVFTRDGTERFYRQVETTLARGAPRLLGCQIDLDATGFGARLYGGDTVAKLVLLQHKDAVAAVLRALVA